SGIVERDSSSLTAGTCDPFDGSWTTVTLVGGADTTVQTGHCYRYRYSVADRVGNRGTQAGTSATVKVDVDAAPAPGPSFSGFDHASATGSTVYYRPDTSGGFSVDRKSVV